MRITARQWKEWQLAFDAMTFRGTTRPVACRESVRLVLGIEPDPEAKA